MTEGTFDAFCRSMTATAISGGAVGRDDLLAVLASSDDELLDVVAAAGRVRRQFFGRRVKLNYLVNMKSGLCPEDCSYCSQRLGSTADVLKYSWIDADEAARHAQCAIGAGAKRVCLVAAGRGPSDREIERVAGTVAAIKDSAPAVEVCVCLGLLKDGQADRLREAGADAYNHNLNTSAENYAQICSTHTFDDRTDDGSGGENRWPVAVFGRDLRDGGVR